MQVDIEIVSKEKKVSRNKEFSGGVGRVKIGELVWPETFLKRNDSTLQIILRIPRRLENERLNCFILIWFKFIPLDVCYHVDKEILTVVVAVDHLLVQTAT